MNKILIYTCLVLSLLCCRSKHENVFQKRNINSNAITIELEQQNSNAISEDTFVKNVTYIKPEATKNSLISNYDKVISCGDTIFILERSSVQQKVFAFNVQGKFLFCVDARGKGPGEYRDISDFYIDQESKRICILDYSQILKYDYSGKYIETIDLKEFYLDRLLFDNNQIYAHSKSLDCKSGYCYSFALLSSNGELKYRDCPVSRKILSFPYNRNIYFSSNSSGVFFNEMKSDTIYKVTDTYLLPSFILDYGNYKMPKEAETKIISKQDVVALMDSKYNILGLKDFIVSDNYLVMNFPAGQKIHTAIYSFKTNASILFSAFKKNEKYLSTLSRIQKFDDNRFFCVTKIADALWLKKNEEYFGVNNDSLKFDKHRIERYNAIKDITENDNDIITVFELIDF